MATLLLPITLAFWILLGPAEPDAVMAGDLIVEPSTPINLEFEWEISGDANRNAVVEVRYRRTGAREWKEALIRTVSPGCTDAAAFRGVARGWASVPG